MIILPLFLHTFQSNSSTPCHQVFDADVVDSILQLVLNCGALPGSLGNDNKPEAALGGASLLQRSNSLQTADDADVASFAPSVSAVAAPATGTAAAGGGSSDAASSAKRPASLPLGQAIMQSTSDALRIEMLKVNSLHTLLFSILIMYLL